MKRLIASVITIGSIISPVLASAAPMHVNEYERRTQLVNNWKTNRPIIEQKLRYLALDKFTNVEMPGYYVAEVATVERHVKSYNCFNRINLNDCQMGRLK